MKYCTFTNFERFGTLFRDGFKEDSGTPGRGGGLKGLKPLP